MSAVAVVLAAGGARRFGSAKQLAHVDGRPLLRRALDPVVASRALEGCVVVLGAEAGRVREAIEPISGVDVVVCADWEQGPARSLVRGLAHLTATEWAVVLLGDELGVPPAAIDRVLGTARTTPGVLAVRATWDGRPGHPVVLHRSLWSRLEDVRGDEGARSLLAGAVEVPCGDLGHPWDVDRPSDIEDRPCSPSP